MSSNINMIVTQTSPMSSGDAPPPSYNDTVSWQAPKQNGVVSSTQQLPSSTNNTIFVIPETRSQVQPQVQPQVQAQTMDRDAQHTPVSRRRTCCGSRHTSGVETVDTNSNCCDSFLNCYIVSLLFNNNGVNGNNGDNSCCCGCNGCDCNDCNCNCDCCKCDSCDCGDCDCSGCDCDCNCDN